MKIGLRNTLKKQKKELNAVKKDIVTTRSTLAERVQQRDSLVFDIEDSKEFIESLEMRLQALSASGEVRKALGGLEFIYCPACLQPVQECDDTDQCHLCKEKEQEDGRASGFLRQENELKFQHRESASLLKNKKLKVEKMEVEIKELQGHLSTLQRKHKTFINTLNPVEAQTKILLSKIGYFDRAIEGAHEKEKLALTIDDLSSRKAKLNEEMSLIETKIEQLESLRESKRASVYTAVSENTLSLLKGDVGNEFNDTEYVTFDFAKNYVEVDNKSKLAASSVAYLKNSFLFSIFLSSLQIDSMRYPRLIILDNIEDNGLEARRVQTFHRELQKYSAEYKDIVHQIIITSSTSFLSEEMMKSEFCVGNHYQDEEDKRSLRFPPLA